MIKKQHDFLKLTQRVQRCRKCARMCDSKRVLNSSAGNLSARLMFIGEAPGRLGADSTQIPFHGDKAGHNFESLLEFANISRENVFVTNAVLCNPKDSDGNNSTPNSEELTNCSNFLKRQIELVDPAVVVSLGATALKALNDVASHQLILREHVRTTNHWFGRLLIPLYHPGQRAMIHRSAANQRSDYQFVSEELRGFSKPPKKVFGKSSSIAASIVEEILRRKGEISYFAIHKLFYLAEYLSVRETGHRMSNAYFIRQKDGPYCTELHLTKLKAALPSLRVVNRKSRIFLTLDEPRGSHLLPFFEEVTTSLEQDDIVRVVRQTLERYNYESDADLKRAVYLTAPMRQILALERREGLNLYNSPINFLEA